MRMTSGDPDFWTDEADSVVCGEQPRTACYMNGQGQLVLRQERGWDEHEDTVILMLPEHVPALVAAMERVSRSIIADRRDMLAGDDRIANSPEPLRQITDQRRRPAGSASLMSAASTSKAAATAPSLNGSGKHQLDAFATA